MEFPSRRVVFLAILSYDCSACIGVELTFFILVSRFLGNSVPAWKVRFL